jgi:hypothetical protein
MGWLVLIVVVVVIMVLVSNAGEKAKRQAREAYQGSLEKLKTDPANSDLRQRTLALGRVY